MLDLTGTTEQGREIARRDLAGDAPFLSAGFWEEGKALHCEVVSLHKSSNGPFILVQLINPSSIEFESADGEVTEHHVVRIGNLAGLGNARRAVLAKQKQKFFVVGDVLTITCTGIVEPTKPGYSPSPNFHLRIQREEGF
jgi:hypothetical protein